MFDVSQLEVDPKKIKEIIDFDLTNHNESEFCLKIKKKVFKLKPTLKQIVLLENYFYKEREKKEKESLASAIDLLSDVKYQRKIYIFTILDIILRNQPDHYAKNNPEYDPQELEDHIINDTLNWFVVAYSILIITAFGGRFGKKFLNTILSKK